MRGRSSFQRGVWLYSTIYISGFPLEPFRRTYATPFRRFSAPKPTHAALVNLAPRCGTGLWRLPWRVMLRPEWSSKPGTALLLRCERELGKLRY